MADYRDGHPAAGAAAPGSDPNDSDVSGTRLATTTQAGEQPNALARTEDADWMRLATAPTLLLRPVGSAEADDAPATSRVPTLPPMALEEQPWFKTGTTVPPPSMRPVAESTAPAPARQPPNPRVFKIVLGVIAGCLFIVAAAGLKLAYRRLTAPAPAPASNAETSAPVMAADLAVPPALADKAENRPTAPAPSGAPSSAAASAETTSRPAPVRTAPAPVRATTKATTRRPPPPAKKPSRGTR